MSDVAAMKDHIATYIQKLSDALAKGPSPKIAALGAALRSAWNDGHAVYLCGNGGSAGNAIHLANDFLFGAGRTAGIGLRVEALSANPAVLTCLANDIGYDSIFSEQLRVKANKGDVLI
ncbi:MAG TPA: SIS domain-containing protein, partial [Lacipirellulaceae bacterium]|nr:SIS domain-containing protein [Lacipirellulaceae bacterium]